ncbi:hypothetical protein ABZP36_025871 [Zizania latifolia]
MRLMSLTPRSLGLTGDRSLRDPEGSRCLQVATELKNYANKLARWCRHDEVGMLGYVQLALYGGWTGSSSSSVSDF